jgi:hypothetical protein
MTEIELSIIRSLIRQLELAVEFGHVIPISAAETLREARELLARLELNPKP